MSDATVQLIRSVVQAAWAVLLGLTAVQAALNELGLDGEYVAGVAITITMALVVWVGRRLDERSRVAGTIVNGISRPPAYDLED